MKKYFIYMIIISTPAIFLNFNSFFWSNRGSTRELFISTVFLILYFLYSGFIGWSNNKVFLKFLIFYWGIGLSFLALTHMMNGYLLFAPIVIFYEFPIYGFSYINSIRIIPFFDFFLIIVTWLLGNIGWLLGNGCYILKSRLNTKDHERL